MTNKASRETLREALASIEEAADYGSTRDELFKDILVTVRKAIAALKADGQEAEQTGLTPMLLMNAALCIEGEVFVPVGKRIAITERLLAAAKALKASPAVVPPDQPVAQMAERRVGNDGLSHRRCHSHDTSNRFRGDGKSAPPAARPVDTPDQVMVPREPTPAMIAAGQEAQWIPTRPGEKIYSYEVAEVYRAMLAAIPKTGTQATIPDEPHG